MAQMEWGTMRLLERLWADERGAPTIEYVLLMSLLALVLIGALVSIGTSLSDTLNTASTNMAGS